MSKYGNVTDADAYHLERGNGVWSDATTEQKNAALLVASEWIDDRFGGQFPGYRTGLREQVREWPRTNAVDMYGYSIGSGSVPSEIERATYEVALREIASAGQLFKDWTPGKEKLSVAVSGAVSVTYAGAFSYIDAQVQIGKIGSIMRSILSDINDTSSLSGRSSRV